MPKKTTINKPQKVELPKKERNIFQKMLVIGTVSMKEILFFTKNLSVLLKSGTTLTEAIEVLQQQAKGKLKYVLEQVAEQIGEGHPFSEALEDHKSTFSNIFVNIVKVGEQSGTLEDNLSYIAEQLDKSYQLRKKILGAMMYPLIVIIGATVLGLGIVLFVLPKVTNLFKGFDVELPLTTRILIAVSDFFQVHGLLALIAGLIGLIVLIILIKQRFVKPITHWIFLYLPVVKNISIHANLASFCRTMSILLKSGVTIDEGIKICSQTVSNYHYQQFLLKTYDKIKAGDTLAGSLAVKKHLFNGTDIQIIKVGEESGSLSDSLAYCATIHEREVDSITENLSNILEPILLVFVGLMVGFLALSIITPIYSITGSIR
ncbi:MAG: type II secretion system F family protein [Candidatus Uhrbacteria bacterium]